MSYDTAVAAAGPPKYRWDLDGDGNDDASSGVNMSLSSPTWSSSIVPSAPSAQCLETGSGSDFNVPNQSDINTSNVDQIAWAVCVQLPNVTNQMSIHEQGGATNSLALYADGADLITVGTDGGAQDSVTMSGVLSANTPYFVAATHDYTNDLITLYLGNLSTGAWSKQSAAVVNNGATIGSHSGDITLGPCAGVDADDATGSNGNWDTVSGVKLQRYLIWSINDTLPSESQLQAIFAAHLGDTSYGSAPPTYRIESRLPDGSFLASLPFRDLQFEIFMNRPTGFRFKVPLREGITKDVLEAGKHEAWIYRNDVLVKCGPIWDATPNSNDGDINCNGADLLDYFDVLRIDAGVEYVATDQFTIVDSLVSTAQAQTGGDYDITSSNGTCGVVKTMAWRRDDGKMVLEAITDLSEEDDGFDFWVNPDRSLDLFYPRLERDQGLRLEYPASIRKYSINYAGKWMRNDVLVLGPDKKYEVAADTTSRSTYGLRQMVESYTDAPSVNAISAYAGYIRDQRRFPKESPNLSIASDHIDIFNDSIIRLGDMITIVIDDGYVQIDKKMRIVGFQVTVGKHGNEGLVLYFNDDREVV